MDGRTLSREHLLAVARGGCSVALTEESRHAIAASRRVVERAVRARRKVYGVTTGFGALSDRTIPPEESAALQLALVRSHASGSGPPLPPELVRAMILLRANSLAHGHSGVRPEVVELLLDFLNHRLLPWIPTEGSVGASGDLAPLAHLALALIGEGSVVIGGGQAAPAGPAIAAEGLHPIVLAEKEGVALVNGTALMEAYLALGVADALSALAAAEVAGALSFDALQGDPAALDDRLGELRQSPEQRAAATALRALVASSQLSAPRAEYRGQDPYTLRCQPQVFAAVASAIGFAERTADAELNAVTDNPVVFEGDEFVNGGNFHGQPLALALDTLALALQYLAAFSERRIARLIDPALNRGLPAFLAPRPGLSSGFMIPQYLAAALVNENLTLVHPASAGSLPTSADQEDFVSMGPWAGAKLRRVLWNTQRVLAIEWVIAGQALELRRPAVGGLGSEAALRALRELVPPLSDDRSLSIELDRVARGVADGSLVERVRATVRF